ncbi:MAG: hypothetical protein ACFB9M_08050 [Myxococcota bacterium]
MADPTKPPHLVLRPDGRLGTPGAPGGLDAEPDKDTGVPSEAWSDGADEEVDAALVGQIDLPRAETTAAPVDPSLYDPFSDDHSGLFAIPAQLPAPHRIPEIRLPASVLVVHEDASVGAGWAARLRELGYVARHLRPPDAARYRGPRFDVSLIDVPSEHGREAVQRCLVELARLEGAWVVAAHAPIPRPAGVEHVIVKPLLWGPTVAALENAREVDSLSGSGPSRAPVRRAAPRVEPFREEEPTERLDAPRIQVNPTNGNGSGDRKMSELDVLAGSAAQNLDDHEEQQRFIQACIRQDALRFAIRTYRALHDAAPDDPRPKHYMKKVGSLLGAYSGPMNRAPSEGMSPRLKGMLVAVLGLGVFMLLMAWLAA